MNTRRTLAALLSAAMLVTMVPLQAFAAEDAADVAEEVSAAAEMEDTPDAPPADVAEEATEIVMAEPEDVPDEEPEDDGIPAVLAETYSGTCGDNVNWSLNTDTGVLTISGTGAMEDYPVDYPGWDIYRGDLTKVVISQGVTSIGEYAFYRCSNITDIKIPASVISIGKGAFSMCSGLTSVTFPNGVTSIADNTFNGCSSLESIVIPGRVTSIGEFAFNDCSGLTSVTIPNSVTSLDTYSFKNCSGLTSIRIPSSVTNIEHSAFEGCSTLARVDITSLESWYGIEFGSSDSNPLYYAHNLYVNNEPVHAITIPDSVTRIESYAFINCSSLTSVTIGDGVTSIGRCAFDGCCGLTSITIPSGVTSISDSVFSHCTSLIEINVDAGNKEYWSIDGVLFTRNEMFGYAELELCPEGKSGSYAIPYNVKCINFSAFEGCTGLTCVTIPNSVTEIGSSAFKDCIGLRTITLPDSVKNINRSVFEGCSGLTSITISDGVIGVGYDAFKNCTGLTSITLPDSVTSIGPSAFSGCSSLTSVTIGNSVMSIDYGAFDNCSALTDVYYTGTLEAWKNIKIKSWNDSLTNATLHCELSELSIIDQPERIIAAKTGEIVQFAVSAIGNGLTYQWQASPDGGSTWSNTAFSGTNTDKISVQAEDMYNGWQFRCIVSEASGKSIISNTAQLTVFTDYGGICGDAVGWSLNVSSGELIILGRGPMQNYDGFINLVPWNNFCSYVKTVTIRDGVTSIGRYTFEGCKELTSVTIPDSVTHIGTYAFGYCQSLKSVKIPNSVTNIGDHAFWDCSYLTGVTIPAGVTSIDDTSFGACYDLAEITVEAANPAFCSIDGVLYTKDKTTLITCPGGKTGACTIPDSVVRIDHYAFMYSKKLTEIIVSSGNTAFMSVDGVLFNRDGTELITFPRGKSGAYEIPSGVINIYDNAFFSCNELTGVTIPDSVTSLGNQFLSYCGKITEITVSSGSAVYCSMDGVMLNKEGTELVRFPGGRSGFYSIPAGVTSIGDSAFDGCRKLTSVTIPKGVESVGSFAFASCSDLTSVTISDTVSLIRGSAFHGCQALSDVYYNDTQERWNAIRIEGYNEPLTRANIHFTFSGTCGDNVSWRLDVETGELSIYGTGEMETFANFSPWYDYRDYVKSVTIGNGVTNISEFIFGLCRNLTSVAIPDSVTVIEFGAFSECSNLTSVTIPNSVTSIGEAAFHRCSSLTNVSIGNGVTSVGRYAFDQCSSLTSISVSGENQYYTDDNGVLYDKVDMVLICCPPKKQGNYVILTGVTGIGDSAFEGCCDLESVTIPNSVTSIGDFAFYNCSSLKDVYYLGTEAEWDAIHFGSHNEFLQEIIHFRPAPIAPLAITSQPKNVTAAVGDIVKFTVAATGNNLTYQWQYKSSAGADWKNNTTMAGCKTATLTVPATAARNGYQYRCVVTSGSNVITSDAATLTVKANLAITSQPKNVTTSVGDTAKFTVTATGSNLTYQWQYKATAGSTWKDNTTMAGCKTATLTVPATAARNGYQYRCVVTSGSNVITSDAATLTVKANLAITRQPKSVTASVGETATFAVTATGSGLTYQWESKAVSGEWGNTSNKGNQTASITVPVTAIRNGNSYRCKVTDSAGNIVYSDAAALTVKAALAITGQPQDVAAAVGETAKFTVTATGSGLAYQWQYKATAGSTWKDNTTMSGCKTATLTVPVTAARNGYQYRCVVTSGSNVITSDVATLTVKANLAITSQPKSVTASVGDTAKFTVTATGSNLTYQWQYKSSSGADWKDNTTMAGCKTATLTVPATAARNGYQYRCLITSGSSGMYSNSATLTVKAAAALSITAQPKSVTASVGDIVKFTVTATGSNLIYQWQYKSSAGAEWKNNTTMAGCKTATLSVPATAARAGYQYRCIVTDSAGNTVTSSAARLTIG